MDPSDLFLADLFGLLQDDTRVPSRVPRRRRPFYPESHDESGALAQVCGFFGPNNLQLTEQQVRTQVVARAVQEWAAWHTAGGATRPEGDGGMFGRLFGYYLAAVSQIAPDTLADIQRAAMAGTVSFAPLLAVAATPATITTEVARLARALITGARGANEPNLQGRVENALRQAREAHTGRGNFAAWSAAFITACIRGAAMTMGLETVDGTTRRQQGRNVLLLATLSHAAYTAEARDRRAATNPPRRGTYHAFTPAERQPQLGDIIVQDRRPGITDTQVRTLPQVAAGQIAHGDIVVEIDPAFVVTIGGNVTDSSRKRRFPRNAQGLLVIDRRQLYTEETNAGTLPPLPLQSTQPLHGHSTARIFAVLSPVQDCGVVPGQAYGGGTLT